MNKKIIIPLLVFFILGFNASRVEAEDSKKDVSPMVKDKKLLTDLVAESQAKPTFAHNDWGTRDPFDTSAFHASLVPLESIKAIILQGIFLGSDKPSAIITGTVMKIGSRINDQTVKEIKENTVVLVDNKGNEKVLLLNQ
jgi:hypothetical protein